MVLSESDSDDALLRQRLNRYDDAPEAKNKSPSSANAANQPNSVIRSVFNKVYSAPVSNGKERNSRRRNLFKTTTFGQISDEDAIKAAAGSFIDLTKLTIEQQTFLQEVTLMTYKRLPQKDVKLIRRGDQLAKNSKDEWIDAIIASELSDFCSAAVKASTREAYRTRFLKFGALPLILKGLNPFPDYFDAVGMQAIISALTKYAGAPRSRHNYLSQVWNFIQFLAPDKKDVASIEAAYSAGFESLHSMAPIKDLETGPRLEHWTRAVSFFARFDPDSSSSIHIPMPGLSTAIFARRINSKPSQKSEKARLIIEEQEFERISKNWMSIQNSSTMVNLLESSRIDAILSHQYKQQPTNSQNHPSKRKALPPRKRLQRSLQQAKRIKKSSEPIFNSISSAPTLAKGELLAESQKSESKSSSSSSPSEDSPTSDVDTSSKKSGTNSLLKPEPKTRKTVSRFSLGERTMCPGISVNMFLGSCIRAWFLLLRPEEWKRITYEELVSIDGKQMARFGLIASETDQFGQGFSWHMKCSCKELQTGRPKENLKNVHSYCVPICPIHCVSHENFVSVASLRPEILSHLWSQLCQVLNWNKFMNIFHKLHILRIGGAQSMIDRGSGLYRVRVMGRWRNESTPALYAKDAERAPALLRLTEWPIAKPFIIGEPVGFDDIVEQLNRSVLWKL